MAESRAGESRNTDTRERILDAAERLFMAHGYDGTSMRQITGDAGVNLAAVNYHFGSKEALMQEAMVSFMTEVESKYCAEFNCGTTSGGAAAKPIR